MSTKNKVNHYISFIIQTTQRAIHHIMKTFVMLEKNYEKCIKLFYLSKFDKIKIRPKMMMNDGWITLIRYVHFFLGNMSR